MLPGRARASGGGPIDTESGHTVFVATLLAQLGNGADTIVTFGVLFADSLDSADILIVATMAAMASVFVLFAVYAVEHPRIGAFVKRHADRVTPFILLFVGTYVLLNTGTDLAPD